jgi:hypothetical protein
MNFLQPSPANSCAFPMALEINREFSKLKLERASVREPGCCLLSHDSVSGTLSTCQPIVRSQHKTWTVFCKSMVLPTFPFRNEGMRFNIIKREHDLYVKVAQLQWLQVNRKELGDTCNARHLYKQWLERACLRGPKDLEII